MRFKSILSITVAASLLAVDLGGAATLRIRYTTPNQDNSGTCPLPILVAMGNNANLKGHWRWWVAGGDSLGGAVEDSVSALPNTLILQDYQVPAGLYRVRGWVSDLGGPSCDTLVTISTFKYQPWKPRF